jgi:hypothetical protein
MRLFFVLISLLLACQNREHSPPVSPEDVPRASQLESAEQIVITCSGPNTSDALTGTKQFNARRLHLTTGSRAVILKQISGRVESRLDVPGHLFNGPMLYLTDARFWDSQLEIELITTNFMPQTGGDVLFDLNLEVPVAAHTSTDISGARNETLGNAQMAAQELKAGEFTLHWYDLRLAGQDWSILHLLYADTREQVPNQRMLNGANCFSVRENAFYVRSRGADLWVMHDHSLASQLEARVPAPGVKAMVATVTNKGAGDADINGFDLQATVTTESGELATWSDTTQACTAILEGQFVLPIIPQGNLGSYRGLSMHIGSDFSRRFTVTCDFHWPTRVTLARQIQIQVAVLGFAFLSQRAGLPLPRTVGDAVMVFGQPTTSMPRITLMQ